MVILVHSGMQGQPVTLLEPKLQCPVNWPCDGGTARRATLPGAARARLPLITNLPRQLGSFSAGGSC